MSDIKDDLLAKSVKDRIDEIEEAFCDMADKLEAVAMAAKLWREEALAAEGEMSQSYSTNQNAIAKWEAARDARYEAGLS